MTGVTEHRRVTQSVRRPLIPDAGDKQICGVSYIGKKLKTAIDKKSQGQKRWLSCWHRLSPRGSRGGAQVSRAHFLAASIVPIGSWGGRCETQAEARSSWGAAREASPSLAVTARSSLGGACASVGLSLPENPPRPPPSLRAESAAPSPPVHLLPLRSPQVSRLHGGFSVPAPRPCSRVLPSLPGPVVMLVIFPASRGIWNKACAP